MGYEMKSSTFIFTLITVAMALFFSACGSKSSALPPNAAKQWTWANGADVVNQLGTYGTEGTPTAANIPGARQNAITWVDNAGNFWLFGGYGYGSTGNSNLLNDLWEYSEGQWIWTSGLEVGGQPGIYGTLGQGALTNIPGARWGSVSWADSSGNLWLFGGYGYGASSSSVGTLNDLWEFTPAQQVIGEPFNPGTWTWIGGSNSTAQPGTYGAQGTASPGNIPGARYGAVSWTDASGNAWLFGGNGVALAGDLGNLNDLWEYSAGEWTWMSGTDLANQQGIYGTLGTSGPANIPGGRFGAVSWTDASGNLWLFSGSGYDSTSADGDLNDLWEFSAGQWTWMSGSNVIYQAGTYGTLGMAASSNVPGARSGAVSWTDKSGNFWLFAGSGCAAPVANNPYPCPQAKSANTGLLNDLWEYSAGQWTWVSGSSGISQVGLYGTEGIGSVENVPGSRTLGGSWTDTSGNFWLLGGTGYDWLGSNGYLNDFWQFTP
jgi:hypothetical protein